MNKDELRVVIVITLVCTVSAGLLSFTMESTKGAIAEAIRQEKLKAINAVLPETSNAPDKEMKQVEFHGSPAHVYIGRGSGGKVVGYAVESSDKNGFAGRIEVMVGVDPQGKVIDSYVLTHKETPGLGDKMNEPAFRNQFNGKSLESGFVFRVKKDKGNVDALTGATITSRAYCRIIAKALKIAKEVRP